jgi:D-ribose pyranose/furanose isomerase RbsD
MVNRSRFVTIHLSEEIEESDTTSSAQLAALLKLLFSEQRVRISSHQSWHKKTGCKTSMLIINNTKTLYSSHI